VSSRIAAAQAALGGGAAGKPPVPAPRRTSATSQASVEKPQSSPPPATPARSTPARTHTTASTPSNTNSNGLVSSRGIGSIDTSSAGAAASSVFHFKGMGKNEKPASNFAPSQPAFPKAKTRDTFAPPPSRRETQAAPPPVQQQEEDPEEEEDVLQGDWYEALYDYESGVSAGVGLVIKNGLLIVECRNPQISRSRLEPRFSSPKRPPRIGGWPISTETKVSFPLLISKLSSYTRVYRRFISRLGCVFYLFGYSYCSWFNLRVSLGINRLVSISN
jgi:hypothetical protein